MKLFFKVKVFFSQTRFRKFILNSYEQLEHNKDHILSLYDRLHDNDHIYSRFEKQAIGDDSKTKMSSMLKRLLNKIDRNIIISHKVINVKKGRTKYSLIILGTPTGEIKFNIGRHRTDLDETFVLRK